MVFIIYFIPHNKKTEGAYIIHPDTIKKIYEYEHTIIMTDKTIILIEQIGEMDSELFRDLY